MRYQKLAELYEALSGTPKRLEKTEILSKFLKYLHESDREILYLLLGSIYPEYNEKKMGISSQLTIKAISKATGTESRQVVREWKNLGDLGEVAEKLTEHKKQSTLHSHILTTEKVISNLRKLPELEGNGTVDKKISLITELLTSASPIEAKYLARTLIGDLRVGIHESTVREAMSSAFFNKDKEASKKIQEAVDKSNDLADVFDIARKGKLKELEKVSLEVGKPIKVMLAQKVEDIKKGFKAVGKPCAIEYKYDGFRLIIHKKEDEIILFTRRLENVTKQFPEVVEYVKKYVKGKSFILDTEAVGFDKKTKKYKPFQAVSQRIRRKYDIEKLKETLPIEINVFDIIYYNGMSQLNEPFEKRTKLIKKIIEKHPYKITPSKQIITKDEKKAEEFYKKALKDNQEGVMMKNLQAVYQPGSRVGHMLKVKPEDRDFDLVITGAEYGTGKRFGWLTSFILSCRDKNNFLEIGKMGTGIKEKEEHGVSFNELTKELKPLIIKEKGRSVTIKPKIVIAVTYQEIQKSPNYSSGFALRFPRFTALRPDKPLSEITTLNEVKKEFER
ncbi:putative DNA ligase-like protein/MT0965 [archaeon BMS3Abin17]|nr:putative DNA ligase-like protein/MT0965 [archaeon BMS3Abin17]HDZ60462.1 ATP-dependent DNA ligase [Candidatus Pacearchaeota archaeon]